MDFQPSVSVARGKKRELGIGIGIGTIIGACVTLLVVHVTSNGNNSSPRLETSQALSAVHMGKQGEDTLTRLNLPDQDHAKSLNENMRMDTSSFPKCKTDASTVEPQAQYDQYCERFQVTKNGVPKEEGGVPICNKVMVQNNSPFQTSCTVLQAANATQGTEANCMGPLASLIGTWIGTHGKVYSIVPNWNSKGGTGHYIPFAGQPTSDITGIKNQQFTEKLVVAPILGAVINRGYENADMINAKCQANQFLQGVSYKLFIYQTSKTDANGVYGNLLHEETGQWMYNSVPASGGGEPTDWTVARMGGKSKHAMTYTGK